MRSFDETDGNTGAVVIFCSELQHAPDWGAYLLIGYLVCETLYSPSIGRRPCHDCGACLRQEQIR